MKETARRSQRENITILQEQLLLIIRRHKRANNYQIVQTLRSVDPNIQTDINIIGVILHRLERYGLVTSILIPQQESRGGPREIKEYTLTPAAETLLIQLAEIRNKILSNSDKYVR
jgi:DNA-binding PadR family transcriptional regulator